MQGIAVAILADDKDRLAILQHRLEETQLARLVLSHLGYPAGPTDPILRQIQDVRAEVVLVDIGPHSPQRAVAGIELIHANTVEIGTFAIGDMAHPPTIVEAMRAGAREFLSHDADSRALTEAFTRFKSSRTKARSSASRARVVMVTNGKGGAGATTLAVNTAIALQENHGPTVLVDFAALGHCALHLNARPSFGVADALQNLHRIDFSLLEGLMTNCRGGLRLLAGPQQPVPIAPTAGELARLFDLLVSHYRYVVIDCSNRMDQTAHLLSELSNTVLLVIQMDVVSLWSASRLFAFLEQGTGRDRVRLVLNRYKKIPGFSDDDIEKATNCKVLWKVPNNYQAVAPAIDKGVPVAQQEAGEVGRSFRTLATALAEAETNEGVPDLIFHPDKSEKKKSSSRLLISPLRANQ